MDRDPDRPRLVGQRPGDRLADPPRRVGRELEPLAVVELLGRAHQAQRPLLDQVEEGQALVAVVLGDRDDQAQVRLDHLLLRVEVAALDPFRELDLLLRGQQSDLADVLQEQLQGIRGHVRLQVERRGLTALAPLVGLRLGGRRCSLRGIDVLDQLDALALEVGVELLDIGLVEVDFGHGSGHLSVGDHAVLLPLDDEALHLVKLLNLCD